MNDCLSDVIEELRTLNGYTKRGARKIRWYFFPSRQGGHLTAEGIRTQWGKSMRNAIKAGVFTEESRFQERDIRAFTASQCETLEQARLLLGHSGDHVTQKHYRREAEVTPVVGQNDKYLSTSN